MSKAAIIWINCVLGRSQGQEVFNPAKSMHAKYEVSSSYLA